MKIDLYTKATLTVIAICLGILSFDKVIPLAEAAAPPQITVCGPRGSYCVDVYDLEGHDGVRDYALSVHVSGMDDSTTSKLADKIASALAREL